MLVLIAQDADGFGEGGSVDAVGRPADNGDEVRLFGADRADHRVWTVVEVLGGVEDALADFRADTEVVGVAVDHSGGC